MRAKKEVRFFARSKRLCGSPNSDNNCSNDYFSCTYMFIKHVLIYSAHVQMVTTPWPRPPAARCQRASRHREFPLIPNRRPSSAPSSSRTNNSRSKNKRFLFHSFILSLYFLFLFSLFKVFFLCLSFFSLSLVFFFFTVLLSTSLNHCCTGVPTISGPSAEAHAASNPRETSHRGSHYSTAFIRTFWDPRNIFYAQLSFNIA